MSAEETAPEGQDFKATEVDLESAADQTEGAAPERSRTEQERAIDRKFFEAHKQDLENQLRYVVDGIEAMRQSLEAAKAAKEAGEEDAFQRPEAIDFLEGRLRTEREIRAILQSNIDRADAGLARLDAEEAGGAA